MYCAFINYEKAFDTVVRDALWFKLVDSGVSCKMVKMIKSLYSKVLAAIKLQTDISSFFEISLGVKQGEPLSPLMFIMFVNDVHSEFSQSLDADSEEVNRINIQQMCLILLLFAEYMVLFSTDPVELQLLLNKLRNRLNDFMTCLWGLTKLYSTEWGLKLNTSKTKICVFQKRISNIDFTWSYNGLNLDIVDSFSHLGVKFTSNGSLEAGVKALSDQALRAVNNLLGLFQRVYFDIKTKLALFDALVTPILLYNAEVWGLYDFPHIDKIHIKFCKILLGVRHCMLYMENWKDFLYRLLLKRELRNFG